MKRIAIESCTLSIQELAKIAETEPVILTREGNPVLGIVCVDEAEVEAWPLGSDPDFLAMGDDGAFSRAWAAIGGRSISEVRRRLDIAKGAGGEFDVAEEAEA